MARCPKCSRTFADTQTTCPHDGEVLLREGEVASDPELKRGDTVSEYVVEGKLGSGTFGDVYRAIQPLIGKQVAIKVLSRKYSADPHIVSRFIAEARAVNQIRHKHIIDIFSFGQLPDGRHYHIMELLNGTTLDEHLKSRGRLPIAETVIILQALARALDAAHAAGIAHRDLKPANVFLARDDDGKPFPKLLDFGIAKLLSDDVPRHHQTATGAAVGTPDYMSPEQCQGPDIDHRTDVYAFGIMTYQLLTGRLPFIGANVVEVLIKQMTAQPEAPSSVVKELPPNIDAPILWMMQKKKEDRPQSLSAAIRALEEAALACGIEVSKTASTGDPTETPAMGMRPAPMISKQPTPPPQASFLADTLPADAKKSFPPLAEAIGSPKRGGMTGPLVAVVALLFAITATVVISKIFASEAVIDEPLRAVVAVPPPVEVAPVPVKEEIVEDKPADLIELHVTSAPASVSIFAGGVQLGRSPCIVRIPRGTDPVMLELKADGYETLTKSIVPLADSSIMLTLRKKSVAKVKTKAPPPSKRARSDEIENAF